MNEPVGFGVDMEEEKLHQTAKTHKEPKILKLKIRHASKFKDTEIEIADTETVFTLKQRWADLYGIDDIGQEGERVKLLGNGRELKSEAFLYQYNLNEDLYLIGVMKY